MNCYIVTIVSLVIVFNCVLSVAKTSDEKTSKSSQNMTGQRDSSLNESMFTEGGISVMTPAKTSRIKPRKGAVLDNSTEALNSSAAQEPPLPSNVTLVLNSTLNSANNKNVTVSSITPTITSTAQAVASQNTTLKATTTSSTTTTTTTKRPIRKPTITYSADDNPDILASEKHINYNVTYPAKSEEVTVPKTSSDTDRTIIDENSTRHNYIIFMSLAVALPVGFTLIHVFYKKVRNWMEIRHYQRVVRFLNR